MTGPSVSRCGDNARRISSAFCYASNVGQAGRACNGRRTLKRLHAVQESNGEHYIRL